MPPAAVNTHCLLIWLLILLIKNSSRSDWSAKRPSTYPQADATLCRPSRWCTALYRAAMRVVASPLRRAAGSGARVHTCWCRRRTADSRPTRRWGSSRSRAPSPADSLWAREDTWTAPSGRTARTAHMNPSTGAQPTETAPSRIRSWKAFCKWLFILTLPENITRTPEQFVITLYDAPLLQVIGFLKWNEKLCKTKKKKRKRKESPHPKSQRKVNKCCALKASADLSAQRYNILSVLIIPVLMTAPVRSSVCASLSGAPEPAAVSPFCGCALDLFPAAAQVWRAHWASAGRPAFLKTAETERRWREAHLPHLGTTPPCFIPSLSPSLPPQQQNPVFHADG